MRQWKTTNRRAFTLTELMVSIVIIAILSSVVLYAMASVQTQAQAQRTKAQIAKVHELLMEKWESYETRRPGNVNSAAVGSLTSQQIRLSAIRELMRLEMPDRVTDVLELKRSNGDFEFDPYGVPLGVVPRVLSQPPVLSRYYRRFAIGHARWGPDEHGWTPEHQAAECLYMILSRIEVADSSALEFFSEKQIGDTDKKIPGRIGDGMPEILDAWGKPIQFVRWPVGFNSDFVDQNELDPFDPARAFQGFTNAGRNGESFLSVPLIVSAGKDGVLDLALSRETGRLFYGDELVPNDPYVALNGNPSMPIFVGAVDDNRDIGTNNAIDNIHSHIIKTSIK